VIFEHMQFNHQSQLTEESAEQFVMDAYTLAENCDYSYMMDNMIQDGLVVGIQNADCHNSCS